MGSFLSVVVRVTNLTCFEKKCMHAGMKKESLGKKSDFIWQKTGQACFRLRPFFSRTGQKRDRFTFFRPWIPSLLLFFCYYANDDDLMTLSLPTKAKRGVLTSKFWRREGFEARKAREHFFV